MSDIFQTFSVPLDAALSSGDSGVLTGGVVSAAALAIEGNESSQSITLNQGITTAISCGVPTSDLSTTSSVGWLSYTNFVTYAKNSLEISDIESKIKEAWDGYRTTEAPNEHGTFFYQVMSWTGSLLTATVSKSPSGGGETMYLLAIIMGGTGFWQNYLVGGTSSGASSPTSTAVAASSYSAIPYSPTQPTGAFSALGPDTSSGIPDSSSMTVSVSSIVDMYGSIAESITIDATAAAEAARALAEGGTSTGVAEEPPPPDTAQPAPLVIPTTTISVADYAEDYGTTIPDLIADSDNVRFDINSSNIFGSSLISQQQETGIITDSTSALEASGISTNRIKILLVSDYDLGLEDASSENLWIDPSQAVLNESFGYSRARHSHIYSFFESVLFKEVELLIELEETYKTKESKLQKSIEYIRSIDEFKTSFISELSDYNKSNLQYIGFMPKLNTTRAIRQAFCNVGWTACNGGDYLMNRLNEAYETPTGLENPVGADRPAAWPLKQYPSSTAAESQSLNQSKPEAPTSVSMSFWTNTFAGQGNTGLSRELFGDNPLRGKNLTKASQTSPEYEFGRSQSQLLRSVHSDLPDSFPSVALNIARDIDGDDKVSSQWKAAINTIKKDCFNNSSAATAAAIAQSQFVELLRSYIIETNEYSMTDGDGIEYATNQSNNMAPLIGDLLGNAGEIATSFSDIDNTKKLGKMLKFPGVENTVYPFEKPSAKFEAGDKKSSVSGIGKWFDENIGNIFEERPTDFRGLDTFAADFQSLVGSVDTRVKAFAVDGHGQLFFNEAARVLRDLLSGELNEVGSHPQTNLKYFRGLGGWDFSEFVESEIAVGEFQPPLTSEEFEELTETYDDIIKGTADWASDQRDADVLNNLILEDNVRESLLEIEETLSSIIGFQDKYFSFDALVDNGVILEAGIPGHPGDGEDFMNSFFDTSSFVDTEVDGIQVDDMMTNAVGEILNGSDLASSMVDTSTEIAQVTSLADAHTMDIESGLSSYGTSGTQYEHTMSQVMTTNYSAANVVSWGMFMYKSDGTTADMGQGATSTDFDFTPSMTDQTLSDGLYEGEQLSLAESKSYFLRKLAFIIELLSKIDGLNPHQFWYLCYNSTQGHVYSKQYQTTGATFNENLLQDLLGPGTVDRAASKLNAHPPFIHQSLVAHVLELVHVVCANIEKNMMFNVAAIAAEYGLSPRSAPADEESNLLGLADAIFGTGARAIYSSSSDVICPIGRGRNTPDADHPGGYSHIELRASVMMMLSYMAKNIKQDLGVSSSLNLIEYAIKPDALQSWFSSQATGAEHQPSVHSRGYVTINKQVNILAIEAMAAKLLLPIVDNVDPKKGPVKWKLIYGDWATSGFKLSTEDFVNRFIIPSAIPTIADEGLNAIEAGNSEIQNALADEYGMGYEGGSYYIGTGDYIEPMAALVRLIRHHFSFTLSIGDIVPYTYVDDAEIPNKSYATSPPRGGLRPIIKSCVYLREDTRRYLEYLNRISNHYLEAKESMIGLADDPNAAELFEHSKLPGIEAQEIIKYSSLRQTFLRSFIASEEAGLASYSYVPSSNFIHPGTTDQAFISVLNKFLKVNACLHADGEIDGGFDVYLDDASLVSNKDNRAENAQILLEEGKIVVLGLPDGLIDTGKSQTPKLVFERLVKIQEVCNHYFPNIPITQNSIDPTFRDFWPCLFINRANIFSSLSTIPDASPTIFLKNLQYGTIDPDTGRYKIIGYSDLQSKLKAIIEQKEDTFNEPTGAYTNMPTASDRAKNIIFNHVLSDLLKIYLDFYAGLNTAETSYSVNLQSNTLYIDPITLENIDIILNHPDIAIESAEVILDDNVIVPFQTYYSRQSSDSSTDMAYDRYSNFIAHTQMRIFSADQMATMTLVPNIFDRTFAVYSHFGQKTKAQSETPYFEFPEIDDSTAQGKVGNDFNAMLAYRSYSS